MACSQSSKLSGGRDFFFSLLTSLFQRVVNPRHAMQILLFRIATLAVARKHLLTRISRSCSDVCLCHLRFDPKREAYQKKNNIPPSSGADHILPSQMASFTLVAPALRNLNSTPESSRKTTAVSTLIPVSANRVLTEQFSSA